MSGTDFLARLKTHPTLSPACVLNDKLVVKQQHKDGVTVFWEVDPKSVFDNGWDRLERVLTCQEDPRILTKMTRIVGYISVLTNWNRSKLMELRDRHGGSYGVEEIEDMHRVQDESSRMRILLQQDGEPIVREMQQEVLH